MSLVSTLLRNGPETEKRDQDASPPSPWPCPHCGRPAEIEAVEPRRLDGVLLTFWNCQRCQTWAVTPATIREPPVWVSSKKQ